MPPAYRFVFEKREFRFSASHFTILGPDTAEGLHGHNFYVKAHCQGPALDSNALLLDIAAFKSALRKVCAHLDNRVLLPAESPHVRITSHEDSGAAEVQVQYNAERYSFPKKSVLELPLPNISVEALATYIWKELSHTVQATGIEKMAVAVEEVEGIYCWYEDDVAVAGAMGHHDC